MTKSDKTKKYFMGSEVEKCPMCNIAPTCVDECGEFGNTLCPYFGKDGIELIDDDDAFDGLDDINIEFKKLDDITGW